MTEVVAIAGGARQDNIYNAELSYEERARLRKQRRQESKTQLVSCPIEMYLVFLVVICS